MSRPQGITGRRKYAASFTAVQFDWIQDQAKTFGIPISEMLRRVIDTGRETITRQQQQQEQNYHRG